MILECFHGFNLSVISFVFGSNKKCFLTYMDTLLIKRTLSMAPSFSVGLY